MQSIQIRNALQKIVEDMGLVWPQKAVIEPPRDTKHGGDFAANIAMVLAKDAKLAPRALAESMLEPIKALPFVADVSVAGPGFLNITLCSEVWHQTIIDIEAQGADYGKNKLGAGKKTQVEFVSANPTGPLHIGHGRGAAVGDSLARILQSCGYDVQTEYYINDVGIQMNILGLSVWLRARELKNLAVDWPEQYYRGDYIIDIAKELLLQQENLLDLPEKEGQDICYKYARQNILDGIKKDLSHFRVHHDVWFSEKSLVAKGAVEQGFAKLAQANLSYESDGALWFATTKFGDDKDRVLKKSDGSLTYFASDIAYHNEKYMRGFDYVIDTWGADHHGYIPRMRAAIAAIGREQEDFDVVLIQLVNLLKNGQNISMSTRAGTFETLSDVIKEVGVDAARFMFLSRKSDSPLDFDLELVKQRTMDNPVYYVQYAHARICALLRRGAERGIVLDKLTDLKALSCLNHVDDLALVRMAARFSNVLEFAANNLAAHHISSYLTEMAGTLHSYYARHHVVQEEDMDLSRARLVLLRAVGQVFANGLQLLGVSAPESM